MCADAFRLEDVPVPSSRDALVLVRVRGTVDMSRAVTLGPRPPPKGVPDKYLPAARNAGSLVIAPLRRPDGTELLLMRGWYAAGTLPAFSQGSSEEVDLVGILRASEEVR